MASAQLSNLKNSKIFTFYYFTCMAALSVLRGQKRESHPLGVELEMVGSHYMGAENKARSFVKLDSAFNL